jgi:hypothetical protein
MLVVLLAFFESHRTNKNWSVVAALARAVGELADAAARIGEILKATAIPADGSPSGGVSAGKAACVETLVPAASILAGALHAYAVEQGDAELAALTDVSESDIGKLNEPKLVAFCSKIVSLATEHLDDLEDYDVEQADVTALDKQTQAFAKECPKPRQKVAKNRANNQALPAQFQKTRQLIDRRIQKLMAKFKTTAPEFYAEYLVARKIVNQPATLGDGAAATVSVVPSPGVASVTKAA